MRVNGLRFVAAAMTLAAWLAGTWPSVGWATDTPRQTVAFRDCKTFFQTNVPYDPRIAIATDAVVVHRHGDALENLTRAIKSWQDKGFVAGRMFFADSDATNAYWKGKWDGVPHEDEVERDAAGNVVLCSGVRPYMLPTEGWTRHLEEMTRTSIEAGADAILPEEPLAHTFTGYEAAFKPLFEKRFGMPWQAESSSPEAHFLTCQLKAELYLELERRLALVTRQEADRIGRPIDFVMPVHSLYSNRASRLVAPMGMALNMEGLDGFVGQVWTGPVRWAQANYSSPDKSFFTSAYALYDYFAALVAGTDKTMWLLSDPVEDDPNHKWSEFEEWYRHSLAAKLMFGDIDTYEVMPWPDRIFLPGYSMGGGTPAPETYRIMLLSALQVQQEIPKQELDRSTLSPGLRIGVAVADSLLWEPHLPEVLDGVYGLLLPLLHEGMWPSASIAERWTEPGYLERFSVLVVSYENFKPTSPQQNADLVDWVRRGGVLVLLGNGGELKGESFWWTRLGQPSALDHLLGLLEIGGDDADTRVGQGCVLRRIDSSRRFAEPDAAREYVKLLEAALQRVEPDAVPKTPGFRINRGPFVIVHALRDIKPHRRPAVLGERPVVDVLDPDLPILEDIRMGAGESKIFRQVQLEDSTPRVLHCTHRLMEQTHDEATSRILIRGPAETPAVVRVYTAQRELTSVTIHSVDGVQLDSQVFPDEGTHSLLIRFPNVPEGAVVRVGWKETSR